ncbi:hypothetical protein [Azospirillum sp. SYSU D00513]|uniref:hypothetical protein n=1 Tax=Azospirillum sp. SYSU D00513 TaxID=2812561 RepID=UPI001A97329B|nr:hypothetical protein [Azospirillum sp. SYSU D00513]
MAFRTVAAAFVVTLAVAGCVTTGQGDGPKIVLKEASSRDRLLAETMGGMLLTPSQRKQLAKRMKQELPKQDLPSNFDTGAGFAGALALGFSPFSAQGVSTAGTISAGLAVVDALTATDRMNQVSAFYLPSQFEGNDIRTSSEATRIAQNMKRARVEAWAKSVGRSVSCVHSCDGPAPLYRITKDAAVKDRYFDPGLIYLTLAQRPMEQVQPTALESQLLGFAPAWKSSGPAGSPFCISMEEFAKDGKFPVSKDPQIGEYAANPCRSEHQNPLIRSLLRALTSDGYMFVGNMHAYSQFFALNGRILQLDRVADKFVTGEIAPETDAGALAPL